MVELKIKVFDAKKEDVVLFDCNTVPIMSTMTVQQFKQLLCKEIDLLSMNIFET